jgi:hypothetical protein
MKMASICIGIRYKGVMYPPNEPPDGFFDGLVVAMKEMLEKRQLEKQSIVFVETPNQEHAG